MIPMSFEEVEYIAKNLGLPKEEVVRKVMFTKLTKRGADIQKRIKERSELAWNEMQEAKNADYVIINPYGEDDERAWEEPIHGVELVIEQFLSIIQKYRRKKFLLVLFGPSCVGKGPLWDSVKNKIKEGVVKLSVGKPTLHVSIETRPIRVEKGERQGHPYIFEPEKVILSLDREHFVIFDVRGVWQALDLYEVEEFLKKNDMVFIEIYYTALPKLREWTKKQSEKSK